MKIPFNFHHLYYFFITAKLGSVSKAAHEMRLSQPALSAQIKQLEEFLGIKLFHREKRRLTLTQEGHWALYYAKAIFDTGQEFIDSVGDRSHKGRIRIQIGVTNSVSKAVTSALLKFILKDTPQTHVILHEAALTEMIASLKDHFLDIVISDMPFQASSEEGIRNYLLGKIPVVFCAHASLAKKFKNFPRSLNDAPMILPTSDSQIFHSVQEFFARHKIAPRISAEVQDTELIHRMVLEGMGIAPLNKYAVLHSTAKDQISFLNKDLKHGIYDPVYLITKLRKRPHPLEEKIAVGFRIKI